MKKILYTCLLVAAVLAKSEAQPVTISLNPSVTYQTMTGWEACDFVTEPCDTDFVDLRNQYIPKLINDVGINRIRLEIRSGVENTTDYYANWVGKGCPSSPDTNYTIWRQNRYANVNDNYNSNVINPNGFHFTELDWKITEMVIPMRQQLAANGENLYINLCYVAFLGQIPAGGTYIHDTVAEYAELVLATYQHMQSTFGFLPDSWEIKLEPDLGSGQWTSTQGTLIGQVIVATAQKLINNGFPAPKFVVPSTTNMSNASTYFDNIIKVSGALQYIDEISYHRYTGVSLSALQNIANRAVQYNKNTSMLEWWNTGLNYKILHQDLEIGRNSAFEQQSIADYFDISTYYNPPKVTINDVTQYTRLYYKYVRKGAQRIDALSGDTALYDALSWINTNGAYTVVIKCEAAGSFKIPGLPAGLYGIKYTTASQKFYARPDTTLPANGIFYASIPAKGVITIHGLQPVVTNAEAHSVPAIESAQVFPNPSTNNTRIVFSNTGANEFVFTLFNMQGQEVSSIEKIRSNAVTLERNGLPAGLYFFRISSTDGQRHIAGKCVFE